MIKEMQDIEVEQVAYGESEWYVAYLPHFGISSMVHFVLFLMIFLFAPSLEIREVPSEKVNFVPHIPVKPVEPVAPPEPPKPPDLSTPAIRDIEDREKVDMPETNVRTLVNEKDMEVSDHYETDDNEDGHGASGDPNQRGVVDTAFQIDSFVKGKGMPTVRGKGTGTGVNERFGQRGPGGRRNLTMAKGGGPRTEDAVKHALEWLRRHQDSDGHWDIDAYDANCKGGHCVGTGTPDYDVAVTGLALLAFLAHGETGHTPGPYQDTVRRGLNWLRGQQSSDGCVGPKTFHKHLYNHSIASMAMAEAVAMGDYNLKGPTQKAIDYLVACQNPGMGWRYTNYNVAGTPAEEGGNNDTSVTGWVVMALKSAKVAELTVPDAAFQGGSAWLDEVLDVDAEYKGTFGYTKKRAFVHKSPYTTTSVGVLVRLLMGQNKGVQEGAATVLDKVPDWKSANLYYWYYATLALFQSGGEAWMKWNEPLKKALCENQEAKNGSCEDGSWDPAQDTWGGEGGRVYTTAMGALCLEVYYRYRQGMTIHDHETPAAPK